MLYEEKIIETIPVGPLGLIPLKTIAFIRKLRYSVARPWPWEEAAKSIR